MKATRLLSAMLCMVVLMACTDSFNVDNNGGEAVPMDPGKGYKEQLYNIEYLNKQFEK